MLDHLDAQKCHVFVSLIEMIPHHRIILHAIKVTFPIIIIIEVILNELNKM